MVKISKGNVLEARALEDNVAPVIVGEFNVWNEVCAKEKGEETWMRNFCSVMKQWGMSYIGWAWYPEEWQPGGWYPALLSETECSSGECVWHSLSYGGRILFEEISGTISKTSDTNTDGKIDIRDITMVAVAYGSKPGDLNWNVVADIDSNGWINIVDIALVAKDYGKTV